MSSAFECFLWLTNVCKRVDLGSRPKAADAKPVSTTFLLIPNVFLRFNATKLTYLPIHRGLIRCETGVTLPAYIELLQPWYYVKRGAYT